MITPSSLLRRCGLSVLLAVAALTAQAQTTTWSNTGTTWGSGGSWSSGVPDSNVERAAFSTSGSPQNPYVDGTYTIQGLTFSNGLTTSYTFGGPGTLVIDSNTNAVANTVQVNGIQTFNIHVTTTNSFSGSSQRFVIGTGSGTMNFGAGYSLTVGTGGLSLQGSGAGAGEFNFYGTVNLGTFALTQQSAATPVYFREGSSINSTASAGIISNSAGNMYFETDAINLGGSASLTMFGSFSSDAGMFLTRNNLNVTENVRIANSASGFTRTVGVDIAGSGTATWSGQVDISANSGSDIVRTVKFQAGAGDRAIFSGNVIASSATVFTDAVQIDGGGTVVLSGTGSTYSADTSVIAGTTLLANNTAGSATGGSAVTVNGVLGGTGRLAMTGSNGLTVSSGGAVAPGDGGMESLEINLAGTSGSASFLSGSTFTFDLDSPTNSDVLLFTGLEAAGDVLFNDNVVNFIDLGGLAPGLYTLMTFDAADAYTGTLSVGTGLGSYTGNFIYNSTSIQLNVVPEPSTGLLLLGGLAGAALLRRRGARHD